MKLVLGLEIHLHLNTKTKMFCGCSADIWGEDPNTHTCPVCLGLPGALPVPNEDAVRKTQLLGLALGSKLNNDSRFERKHYFYPDLPKGYQISQYKQPLCVGGELELDSGMVAKIERVHLEEDVAKSFHEKDKTLLDFNKSGIPLVEIVSNPCFTNVKDAVDYSKKIQQILRALGIGDCDMEKGQMRLEANISLRTEEMEEKGELSPYKVEIKNINSFRFMEKAVEAEIKRQTEIFEKGETPIQENRGYDEDRGETITQRTKEEAKDYRYFPEPDIPPMEFTDDYIKELKMELPELPHQMKEKLINMGVSENYANIIVNKFEKGGVEKFEELVAKGLDPNSVAGLFVNRKGITELSFEEIKATLEGGEALDNEEELEGIISEVISENPKAVADFKDGKDTAIQFLLGQVMRKTQGKADPNISTKIIINLLNL
ncbi:MAG: Asp-tRNA(Asn)/Glu-tRNA(Gln) amidotransferase subunit GatB [Patescibacteria group bacterium]